MRAQVAQAYLRRQVVAQQLAGGVREQNLPAMPYRQQPRHLVKRRAEVVAVALVGCSGVQYRTHTQGRRPPWLGLELTLGGQGGGERLVRGGEGGVEGIADRLEDVAAVGLDSLAQEGIVAGQAICIAWG